MTKRGYIGLREIRELVEWHNRQSAEGVGTGNSVEEWCEARQIDLAAIAAAGRGQCTLSLHEIGRGKMGLPMALQTTFLAGFQVGLDSERHRRDALELST